MATENTTYIVNRDQNKIGSNHDLHEEILFDSNNDASGYEEIEMSFADGAIDIIIDLLTNLSADRGAYALREAFSNAYDATVCTGDMTLPIEIALPHIANEANDTLASKLGYTVADAQASNLVVRDHGIGMTEQEVRCYFTQYGGSNKRSTNDVDTIGSKGLGSKAPLAVADTFTVRTTKDGITTTAILERRAGKNFASITTENTGEESGTEVIVPVTDPAIAQQMEDCAASIGKYSLAANVLVDGRRIPSLLAENPDDAQESPYIFFGNVKIGEDSEGNDVHVRVWRNRDGFERRISSYSSMMFVLAGVAYRLAGSGYRATKEAEVIVEGLPGFLNFTPSRDEIQKDAARENFIEALVAGVNAGMDSKHVVAYLETLSAPERLKWALSNYPDIKTDDAGATHFESNSCIPFAFEADNNIFVTESGYDMLTAISDNDEGGDLFNASFDSRHFNVAAGSSKGAFRLRSVSKKDFASSVTYYVPFFFGEGDNDGRDPKKCGNNVKSILRENILAYHPDHNLVIITGCDDVDKFRRFTNRESAIRAELNITRCAYLFVPAGRELDTDENTILEYTYDNITRWAYDEMVENTKKTSFYVPSGRSGSTGGYTRPSAAEEIDRNYPVYDVNSEWCPTASVNYAARSEHLDLNDEENLYGCALYIASEGRSSNELHALVDILATAGKLDCTRVISLVGLSANAVNRICKNAEKVGADILYDAREKLKSRKKGILQNIKHVKVSWCSYRRSLDISITDQFFIDNKGAFSKHALEAIAWNARSIYSFDNVTEFVKMVSEEKVTRNTPAAIRNAIGLMNMHADEYGRFFNDHVGITIIKTMPNAFDGYISCLYELNSIVARMNEEIYDLSRVFGGSSELRALVAPAIFAKACETAKNIAKETRKEKSDGENNPFSVAA